MVGSLLCYYFTPLNQRLDGYIIYILKVLVKVLKYINYIDLYLKLVTQRSTSLFMFCTSI